MHCGNSPMLQVRQPETEADLAEVRALFMEYQQAIGVDLGFQGFAEELANLPGVYAPPEGRLYLGYHHGLAVASAALKPIADNRCELKRMYVRPAHRGHGLGRALATRLIDDARRIGYTRLCLDTLPTMPEAQKLYESLDFVEVSPYHHNPLMGIRYLALDL